MDILIVIMSMLAVWRATYMLQDEIGPKAIFSRLQAYIATKEGKPGSFAQGFFCFNCMSIWWSVVIACLITDGALNIFLYTMGISAGAIIVNVIVNGKNSEK